MKTYTKTAACGLLALAAMGATAQAEEEFFLDRNNITVEGGWMFDMSNGLSVDSLWGGNIGIGWSFNETTDSYWSAYMKLGMFRGEQFTQASDGNKIIVGGETYSLTHDYKFSQEIIPLLFGGEYHYKLSASVSVYGGLQMGAYFSDISSKYRMAKGYANGKLVYDTHYYSKTSYVFFGGVNLGVTWRFAPKWEANVGIAIQQTLSRMDSAVAGMQIRRYARRSCTAGVISLGVTYTY